MKFNCLYTNFNGIQVNKVCNFEQHMESIKKWVILVSMIFTQIISYAQNKDSIAKWEYGYTRIQKTGMLTLGTFSILNIGTGIIGNYGLKNPEKSFFQMNAAWNSVNFSLAVIGLLKKQPKLLKPLKAQLKAEKIYIFNSALDLSYVAFGYALLNRSKIIGENQLQLKGWGNSIISQGLSLLIFDVWMLRRLKKNAKYNLPNYE